MNEDLNAMTLSDALRHLAKKARAGGPVWQGSDLTGRETLASLGALDLLAELGGWEIRISAVRKT